MTFGGNSQPKWKFLWHLQIMVSAEYSLLFLICGLVTLSLQRYLAVWYWNRCRTFRPNYSHLFQDWRLWSSDNGCHEIQWVQVKSIWCDPLSEMFLYGLCGLLHKTAISSDECVHYEAVNSCEVGQQNSYLCFMPSSSDRYESQEMDLHGFAMVTMTFLKRMLIMAQRSNPDNISMKLPQGCLCPAVIKQN